MFPAAACSVASCGPSLLAAPSLSPAGYFKLLGKGQLPQQPVVVRAKFVSKLAEKKIKEVRLGWGKEQKSVGLIELLIDEQGGGKKRKRPEEWPFSVSHKCHAADCWLQLQQCSLPAPLLLAAL